MEPYKVLVWGDSIARQNEVPWPESCRYSFEVSCFCGRMVEFINIAQCGLAAVHGQNYFEEKVRPVQPDLVIIQFGFNDMRHDTAHNGAPIGTPDQYEEAMCNMIRNARSTGAEVLVLGNHNISFGAIRLYPTGLNGDETVDVYRQRAKRAAEKEGAAFINMAEVLESQGLPPRVATCDGCHLSPDGVKVYAITVCNFILKRLLAL